MPNLNIIFETGGFHDGWKAVFQGYTEFCKKNYTDINFNLINSRDIQTPCDCRDKYGALSLIVENPQTKNFYLVSYWDRIQDMYQNLESRGEIDKCVEFFSSAGGHTDYLHCKPTHYKYTPISYTTTKSYNESLIEELHYSNISRKNKNRLEFKGLLYDLRLHLSNDKRFKVIKDIIPIEDYIRSLNGNLINLSRK